MHEIEQALNSVREVFVNIPKRYEDAKEALRKCENEHQDLLHVIEFAPLDAVKMTKTLKELREIRQERRRLKDELEILEAAKELISIPKAF